MAKKWDEQQEIARLNTMLLYEREGKAQGFLNVAGIDEAGRGPMAGPVVAAAVIMDTSQLIFGVNDSKKISEKMREGLFDEILSKAIAVGVTVVDRERIDEINILNATKEAMAKSIQKLKVSPDYLLLDAILLKEITLPQKSLIKGDSKSYSIACASIVAKVVRDRLMAYYGKKYPEYGFEKHKGYGTKAHQEAMIKYGLTKIHRRSFRFKGGILGE